MPDIIKNKTNYYSDGGTNNKPVRAKKPIENKDSGKITEDSKTYREAMENARGLDWGLQVPRDQMFYFASPQQIEGLRLLEQQQMWDWYYKNMANPAYPYPETSRPKMNWSVSPNQAFRDEQNQPIADIYNTWNYYRYLKSEAPQDFWEYYFQNYRTTEL